MPACLKIWYCSGGRSFLHSASDFVIFSGGAVLFSLFWMFLLLSIYGAVVVWAGAAEVEEERLWAG